MRQTMWNQQRSSQTKRWSKVCLQSISNCTASSPPTLLSHLSVRDKLGEESPDCGQMVVWALVSVLAWTVWAVLQLAGIFVVFAPTAHEWSTSLPCGRRVRCWRESNERNPAVCGRRLFALLPSRGHSRSAFVFGACVTSGALIGLGGYGVMSHSSLGHGAVIASLIHESAYIIAFVCAIKMWYHWLQWDEELGEEGGGSDRVPPPAGSGFLSRHHNFLVVLAQSLCIATSIVAIVIQIILQSHESGAAPRGYIMLDLITHAARLQCVAAYSTMTGRILRVRSRRLERLANKTAALEERMTRFQHTPSSGEVIACVKEFLWIPPVDEDDPIRRVHWAVHIGGTAITASGLASMVVMIVDVVLPTDRPTGIDREGAKLLDWDLWATSAYAILSVVIVSFHVTILNNLYETTVFRMRRLLATFIASRWDEENVERAAATPFNFQPPESLLAEVRHREEYPGVFEFHALGVMDSKTFNFIQLLATVGSVISILLGIFSASF